METRPDAECVLLVSPNGNYAEVLSKQDDKITALFGCGEEKTVPLAEFEKLGAKPVKVWRMNLGGKPVYLDGETITKGDLYMNGQRSPMPKGKKS